MSNRFENADGLERDSPKDAGLDMDGDGADNLSESIAGTDPNDAGSAFRILNPEDAPVSFSVTWPTLVERTYEVFWSTDLSDWNSDSNYPGTGSDITMELEKAVIDAADTISDNLNRLFVRVVVSHSTNALAYCTYQRDCLVKRAWLIDFYCSATPQRASVVSPARTFAETSRYVVPCKAPSHGSATLIASVGALAFVR